MELYQILDNALGIDENNETPKKKINNSGLFKWQLEYYLNFLDYWEYSEGYFSLMTEILPMDSIRSLLDICIENMDEELLRHSRTDIYRKSNQLKNEYDIGDSILEFINLGKNNEKVIYSFFKNTFSQYKEKCENVITLYTERLESLKNLFEFDEQEIELIRFFLTVGINSSFIKFINSKRHDRNFHELCEIVSTFTKLQKGTIKRLLKKDNKLWLLQVFNYEGMGADFPTDLEEDIKGFLNGLTEDNFSDKYFVKDISSVLGSSNLRVTTSDTDNVKSLLMSKSNINILLYGEPGSGKTEFARSVISEIGKTPYFVCVVENDSRGRNRVDGMCRNLFVTTNIAGKNNGVVIFDEADSFLNRGFFGHDGLYNGDKGWLNGYLDECKAQIIWIVNHIQHIDTSSRRRFQYSIHFTDFTKNERIIAWNSILKDSHLKNYLSEEFIDETSEKYDLSPGLIKNAVSSVQKILQTKTELNSTLVKSKINEILTKHYELHYGEKLPSTPNIISAYNPDILNTDKKLSDLENSLSKFFQCHKNDGVKLPGHNMNFLFWGIPGSGKTEIAKYLSRKFKKRLIIKKASDLLSMWLGMSEKLIRKSFDDAEREDSILLIDEADSFLQNREGASKSWEITQVNEFLTCMENFSGVLICTTNFMNNLDPASLRRFSWKVEFKPLRDSDKVHLFEKYFLTICDMANMSSIERIRIENIPNLTPGDFKSVWSRNQFTSEKLNISCLIVELESEVKYKTENKKKVGFGC